MKAKDWLLVALGIYSIALTINQCYQGSSNKEEVNPGTSPKIIYREVSLPKGEGSQVIPSTVIMPPDSKSLRQVKETVPPIKDSVAAVEIQKSNLKFTFSDSVGKLSQHQYNLDLDRYKYTWVDGRLTAVKIPTFKRYKFSPYAGISYRPFNKLLDAEAGIKLKSEHLTYSLAIQGFYYPKFKAEPGWDVKIGLQYEF